MQVYGLFHMWKVGIVDPQHTPISASTVHITSNTRI